MKRPPGRWCKREWRHTRLLRARSSILLQSPSSTRTPGLGQEKSATIVTGRRWRPPTTNIQMTKQSCSTDCRSWVPFRRDPRDFRTGQGAALFEDVYSRHPDHPGVLHYLIHAYDDPEHAQQGLKAARAYAQAAAAVPHALHMPSHIFTRLGYWEESAATNLRGWEVEAFAAEAIGDANGAVAKLREAAAIEDAIDDLSQPPYPIIPANELCGSLLLELNRQAEAVTYFQRTLTRTPGRPKAIFELARAAQALGDSETATHRYQEFLSIWKNADPGLPELAQAMEFLGARQK